MKKRKRPIRKIPLEEVYNESKLNYEETINYTHLKEFDISTKQERIVFDGCIFEKVTLTKKHLKRSEFLDCTFINCDLSNNEFHSSTFIRCEFKDTTLLGTSFIESFISDTLFKSCNLSYLDIANTEVKISEINKSLLQESSWFDTKLKDVLLIDNKLLKSRIYNTSCKGIDISTSEIEGLQIDEYSLRGLIISEDQAPLFCSFLGIKVK